MVLNEEEYKALKRLFTGNITRDKFLLTNDEYIDISKVIDLFDNTKETQK